jgi:Domain of unknown function (DUF5664)
MLNEQGTKHDNGKPRMELLPGESLEDIAKVFAFGAVKYGDWNWRGGIKISRLMGAVLRHIFAFLCGETRDPESGLLHVSHAACGLLMVIATLKNRPDMDDRYNGK